MKKKRQDFARCRRHWTLAGWQKVLVSDECTMQQFVLRHMHIKRPLGKRFDKKCLVATKKHVPSQTIWGVMSCCGAAGLYFIPSMNGPSYVDLLKEKLKLHVHGCMQDGASWHRSKVATEFLEKNKISVLEWSENSPDINRVEKHNKVAYRHWVHEASNQGRLGHWNHPGVLIISGSHWQQRRTYQLLKSSDTGTSWRHQV